MIKAVMHFDGASQPHTANGVASYGFHIAYNGQEISDTKRVDPKYPQTNNSAEYMGLLMGLRKALELGIENIEVKGDSELVVYQLTPHPKYGKPYKVKQPHLRELNSEIQKLIPKFKSFSLTHVRREFNTVADGLSRTTG